MADTMETYSCFVNLGGDPGQQVPKDNVTAGEIAVLQAVHGPDAVTEIRSTGKVERSNKQERERLNYFYSASATRDGNANALATLFPGIGARLPTNVKELELPEDYFAQDKKGREKREPEKTEAEETAEVREETMAARLEDERKAAKATEKAVKAGKSKRSSATGTGLLGKADAPDPRPPIGKGGAGSLGSKGGIDGEGTKPDPNADEDDDDGAMDLNDAHTERPGGNVLE